MNSGYRYLTKKNSKTKTKLIKKRLKLPIHIGQKRMKIWAIWLLAVLQGLWTPQKTLIKSKFQNKKKMKSDLNLLLFGWPFLYQYVIFIWHWHVLIYCLLKYIIIGFKYFSWVKIIKCFRAFPRVIPFLNYK